MVFTGQVTSDFLKSVVVARDKKPAMVNFAGTDFLELRESIINYIKAVYPLDYHNFQESDLGMMLVEIVAYMGAVLSHKADAVANENYIRTATQRSSVRKLLELIGVKLRGPISAAANAQITWDWETEAGSPWFGSVGESPSNPILITPGNRVITVTSPEDGEQITYTLYKVRNDGLVEISNATGNVSLTAGEATGDVSSVHPNLALLEGSLVVQEGTFVTTEVSKSIALEKGPVVEGSVDVFIQGGDVNTSGTYTEVENIYATSGNTDKIFQIAADDNFTANVIFGDNFISRSPNIGDTFVVTYRVGGGTRGNIASNIINTQIEGTVGGALYNGTITNTSMGTGGSDAESLDHAKKYGPMTFRRQDRLVTLPDFEAFANRYISKYGSTGKATVSVRKAYSSANIIDIYVLEKASNTQLRRATPQFKSELLASMNKKKMLTDELVIVDGLIRALDLVVTIKIDKENERLQQEILSLSRAKILDYFTVDNTEFEQTLILQDLIRSIHDLDYVRYATVDNLSSNIKVEHNEIIQLNNLTINIDSI